MPTLRVPGARVARDHGRQRDERRRVARPARLDRQQAEVDLVAASARPPGRRRCGRSSAASRRSTSASCSPRTFSTSPCGGCISSTSASFGATSSSRSTPKPRHMRRSVPNWLISSGCSQPFGPLEEERRAAGLDRAVDDLRHLEVRVDLGVDADELALALEERDPCAQVGGRRHRGESRRQSTPYAASRRLTAASRARGGACGRRAAVDSPSAMSGEATDQCREPRHPVERAAWSPRRPSSPILERPTACDERASRASSRGRAERADGLGVRASASTRRSGSAGARPMIVGRSRRRRPRRRDATCSGRGTRRARDARSRRGAAEPARGSPSSDHAR